MNYAKKLEELLEYKIMDLNILVDPDEFPNVFEDSEAREEAKEEIIKLIKEL